MDSEKKLEQRVRTLEYEVKIVKSEIQRTLLDIQEQILIHYYPDLRTESDKAEAGVVQSLEAVRKKRDLMAPAPAEPEPTASPPEAEEAPAQGAAPKPKGKQVSLAEVRAAQQTAPPPQETSQAQVTALSGWITRLVLRIGQQRVSNLLEAAVLRGWLTIDVVDVLHKVIAFVNVDSVPETVAVNDILKAVIELNKLLGREDDVDEALALVEEANLG